MKDMSDVGGCIKGVKWGFLKVQGFVLGDFRAIGELEGEDE